MGIVRISAASIGSTWQGADLQIGDTYTSIRPTVDLSLSILTTSKRSLIPHIYGMGMLRS